MIDLSTGSIESSRRSILDEIGEPPDLVLLRTGHTPGARLVRAGARNLLTGRQNRELRLGQLAREVGHTLLFAAGGGSSRPDHNVLSRALRVAAVRFERVIVLPSCLEVSDEVIADALSRTEAVVFASEPRTYAQLSSVCDARLAHDCAFFFDYAPHMREGNGVLVAVRDEERPAAVGPEEDSLPPENDLSGWLEAIARHEVVRTDDPHVMIAAAMLGKRAQYVPDSEHKLQALAKFALSGLPISPIARRPAAEALIRPQPPKLDPDAEHTVRRLERLVGPAPAGACSPSAEPRVTAVVVSRNRPGPALRALESLQRSTVPLEILVIDNNSAPAASEALAAACARSDRIRLRRSDRNLGCAGGRRLGSELVETELALFLDDDAELLTGALERLLMELDSYPQTGAVTATVLSHDASIMFAGGKIVRSADVAHFDVPSMGCSYFDDVLPPTGPTGWVSGTAFLARRELLEAFPIDVGMSAYFEDAEWSYRVELERPGSFRRSREAMAIHRSIYKPFAEPTFKGRSLAVEWLAALAHFYARHRVLVSWVFFLAPDLLVGDGYFDLAGARLLMDLLADRGTDWTFTAWMNGELEGLLSSHRWL